jgi:hypothetical protein
VGGVRCIRTHGRLGGRSSQSGVECCSCVTETI